MEQFIQLLKDFGYDTYEREGEQDKNKPVYAQIDLKADLNVNGLINGIDLSKQQCNAIGFNLVDGYPYYSVKNSDVSTETYQVEAISGLISQDITDMTELGLILNAKYNVLKINVPNDIKNVFVKTLNRRNVLELF